MSVVAEKPVREHLYEGMFLVDSGKFAMDPDGVTNDILAVLKRAGAAVVAYRPWQDGKRHEINGMKKGHAALHRVLHDARLWHEDSGSSVSAERNHCPSNR